MSSKEIILKSEINPIIIIFEYHQVTAGEQLLQSNLSGLAELGYRTYLDEEACDMRLERKISMQAGLVEQAQEISHDSPEYWQKVVVEKRLASLNLLNELKFNYFAYDLSTSEMQILMLANLHIIKEHPKGIMQAFNDLASGKDPDNMTIYNSRVIKQNQQFSKAAIGCKDGVICIAGIYHAKHLQPYLAKNFPDRDVLCYFPYMGSPFEEFEVNARESVGDDDIFPTGAKVINYNSLESGSECNLIEKDIKVYQSMLELFNLLEASLFIEKEQVSMSTLSSYRDQLYQAQEQLISLPGLNNKALYHYKINLYLSQCALLENNLGDVEKFYKSACVHAKNLPKSETKSELIKYSKQLVKQYQALKKTQTQQNDYAARQRLFSDKKNDQEVTLLVDEANQLEIKL